MEHHSSDSGWRVIRDPRAARILTDVKHLKYLTPFLRAEATVGQAAARAGVGNDDMYYRVERMRARDVLRVVRTEPRAGKALKYYSIGAPGLFVPFAATPADTLESLVLGTDADFQQRMVRGVMTGFREALGDPETWGFRIYEDDDGNDHFDFGPEDAPPGWNLQSFLNEPEKPALNAVWTEISLTHEDAKDLQRGLHELQTAFQRRSQERRRELPSRRYLLRLALAPLDPSDASGGA